MTPIGNLPTIVAAAAIEVADGPARTACQAYTRDWVAGGFMFAYCEQPQRYLISWSVPDRWRTRRQLRVCHAHGATFAEANGLALDGSRLSVAAAIRTAAAPVVAADDDPFADSDQPYERTREAGR